MIRRSGLISGNTGDQARPLRVDIRQKGTDVEPIEAKYKVRSSNPDLLKLIVGRNNWREGTDVLRIRAHILGRDNLELSRSCPSEQPNQCPQTDIIGDSLEASMMDRSAIPQECVDCIAQYLLAATSAYKEVPVASDLL
jgi:hypothetical protein